MEGLIRGGGAQGWLRKAGRADGACEELEERGLGEPQGLEEAGSVEEPG